MAIKVLIFDLDGTLFDTREDIIDAVNYARAAFGLPLLTGKAIVSMVGNGMGMLAARAFEGTSVSEEAGRERIMEYYEVHAADKARPFPGVVKTLPSLLSPRVVISNKPKRLVDDLLEKNGMTGWFDFVAGGDTFERRKPDPLAVDFVRDRYRVSAQEILVVGDHWPDIEMAKRAGAKSVYCNYGFFGHDTVGADYRIDCFDELPGILAELGTTPD